VAKELSGLDCANAGHSRLRSRIAGIGAQLERNGVVAERIFAKLLYERAPRRADSAAKDLSEKKPSAIYLCHSNVHPLCLDDPLIAPSSAGTSSGLD